jgi:hypothetical protein
MASAIATTDDRVPLVRDQLQPLLARCLLREALELGALPTARAAPAPGPDRSRGSGGCPAWPTALS